MMNSLASQLLHQPRQLRARRAIAIVHTLCGVVLGAVLLCLGLSGAALVFKDQIEPSIYPQLMQSSPQSPLVTVDDVLASAKTKSEGLRPLLIDFGTQPAAAIYLSHGLWFPSSDVRVTYVDLGSGHVLGSRSYGGGFFNTLMHLHTELFLGARGSKVLGGLSLLLILMVISGYLLWWPGIGRWRRALRIDWKARYARVNWDAHNATGAFLGVLLLVQGTSAFGLTLGLPLLTSLFPGTAGEIMRFDEAPRSSSGQEMADTKLGPLVRQSLLNHPDMKLESIALAVDPTDPIVVTLGTAQFVSRGSQARLAFDRYRGTLLSDIDSDRGSLILRLYVLMGPLHFGRVAGLWSQGVWAALGFVPAILFLTGFGMWWRRVPAKFVGYPKARSR